MIAPKARNTIFAHVALERRWIGLAQVYHDESIEDVGKIAVHVKAQQAAAQPGILSERLTGCRARS